MKFIKWLFKPEPLQELVPPVKKERDLVVGEPIISFVELVKNSPRRFKMRLRINTGGVRPVARNQIFDKLTKELFWYEKRYPKWTGVRDYATFTGNPAFLTQDEWRYIDRYLGEDSNQKVVNRYLSIKTAKSYRLASEERQRYMDVYCSK